MICNTCGREIDQQDSFPVGVPEEYTQCFICHCDSLECGEITQCDECGAYFTPNHLEINPETSERELCPYCGRVWCK